jgi:hypothetical protein
MRTRLSAILLCAASTWAVAQTEGQLAYNTKVKEAFDLYEKKQFLGSAQAYSEAFKAIGWKGSQNDRYNAACSWALASVPDTAFFNLFRIAEKMDYANLDHIQRDADLNSLHADGRWPQLIDLVKANKERLEANLDKPLVALLDSIQNEDQDLRVQIDAVEQQYGRDHDEMKAHWRKIQQKDSTNVLAITKILDERGWLGADVVGGTGNSTLFLVIQHADLSIQEKYLPMMRDAVKKGNAEGGSLALLEDRVLMRNGKRQIYGSQIGRDPDSGTYFLSPLEDPDHVDERRASVGLGPIAEYLTNWDMTWDVKAYKRDLPALQERINANSK